MSRRFSDSVTWAAGEISRQLEGGVERLEVTLSLASGRALLLAVGLREESSRRTWGLSLPGEGPCPLCRRNVEALRGEGASPSELARLIYRAVNVVASCGCAAGAREHIGGRRRGEHRPTPPPRRINVLPQSHASADSAPQAAAGVIRVKPPSSAASAASRRAEDAGEARAGAPSFNYSLAGGVAVGVTLTDRVCRLLARHCDESNRHGREVGGVIAGYSFEAEDADGRKSIQTVATDIIPVEASDSSGAHLCLGEQDWLHVQRQFDEKYTAQGKVRVGWYHTHPTQSVFFSSMDADAHTVFRQPHQFALVVDPRKMEAGLFYWSDYEKLRHAGPLRFMLEARGAGDGRGGGAGLRESLAAYAHAARGRLGGRSLVALAAVLLMSGTALYLLKRQPGPPAGGTRGTTAAQRQAAAEAPPAQADDAQPKQPTHLLLISEVIVDGKESRTLAAAGPRAPEVTYVAGRPQNGRARWEATKKSEAIFFRKVFAWEIEWEQSTAEQKAFQTALGIAEADGRWGPGTRSALLSKAVELRESGGLLVFKLGGEEVRVRFMGAGGGSPRGQH